MIFLSALLYFISHHGFLFALCLMFIAIVLPVKLGKIALFSKIAFPVAAFILSIISAFTSQFLNAAFLNAFGTRSTAVITKEKQTNSTLNDAYIYDYDFIVKKTNGQYVKGTFSTTTAAIYPITNAIQIPSKGQEFPVKYIPGYEKNIVILFNESDDGIAARRSESLSALDKARIQYEASPNEKDFQQEYIEALKKFIKENQDIDLSSYKEKLSHLKSNL